jgi:hypothetical protein
MTCMSLHIIMYNGHFFIYLFIFLTKNIFSLKDDHYSLETNTSLKEAEDMKKDKSSTQQ